MVQGQGQGLANWSSRTRTFREDNNTNYLLSYFCPNLRHDIILRYVSLSLTCNFSFAVQLTRDWFRCSLGMSSERPIRVLDVSARPSPIRTPGRVKLSALVNVTSELPTGLNADVLVSKSVLGIHLKIPCYRNIGSWYIRRFLAVTFTDTYSLRS